jgi:DNA-binding transcriptional LysR family regulator
VSGLRHIEKLWIDGIDVEIRQLKYFVRIIELGSVSRAAADLFIAQPALSHQISNLEEELKVKLMSRSVRGVTATEAGNVFYRHARAVLRQMERMRTDVQHAGDHPQGLVSVGMPTSAATILAPVLIASSRERYPDIQLQITESLSGHLEELVVNGRIDMSLLFEHSEPGSAAPNTATRKAVGHLDVRPLMQEELYLLTSLDKSGGDLDVTLAKAAQYPLVMPGQSNVTRQIVDAAFRKAGHEMTLVAELDSLSTIMSVVASGVGATILSSSGPQAAKGLMARRIIEPVLARRVVLCTFDILPKSTAAQRIVDLIVEISASLAASGAWRGVSLIADAGLVAAAPAQP